MIREAVGQSKFCKIRNIFRKEWHAGYNKQWRGVDARRKMMSQIIEQATWWSALCKYFSKEPATEVPAAEKIQQIMKTVAEWRGKSVEVEAYAQDETESNKMLNLLKASSDVTCVYSAKGAEYIYDDEDVVKKLNFMLSKIVRGDGEEKWWNCSLNIQSVITDNIKFFWPNHNPQAGGPTWWVFDAAKPNQRTSTDGVCLLDAVQRASNQILRFPPCLSFESEKKGGRLTDRQRRKCCLRCAAKLAIKSEGAEPKIVSDWKKGQKEAKAKAKVARKALVTITEDVNSLFTEIETQAFQEIDLQEMKSFLEIRRERLDAQTSVLRAGAIAAAVGAGVAAAAAAFVVGPASALGALYKAAPDALKALQNGRDFIQKPSTATLSALASSISDSTTTFGDKLRAAGIRKAATKEAEEKKKIERGREMRSAELRTKMRISFPGKAFTDSELKTAAISWGERIKRAEKVVQDAKRSKEGDVGSDDAIRDAAAKLEALKSPEVYDPLMQEMREQMAALGDDFDMKNFFEKYNPAGLGPCISKGKRECLEQYKWNDDEEEERRREAKLPVLSEGVKAELIELQKEIQEADKSAIDPDKKSESRQKYHEKFQTIDKSIQEHILTKCLEKMVKECSAAKQQREATATRLRRRRLRLGRSRNRGGRRRRWRRWRRRRRRQRRRPEA